MGNNVPRFRDRDKYKINNSPFKNIDYLSGEDVSNLAKPSDMFASISANISKISGARAKMLDEYAKHLEPAKNDYLRDENVLKGLEAINNYALSPQYTNSREFIQVVKSKILGETLKDVPDKYKSQVGTLLLDKAVGISQKLDEQRLAREEKGLRAYQITTIEGAVEEKRRLLNTLTVDGSEPFSAKFDREKLSDELDKIFQDKMYLVSDGNRKILRDQHLDSLEASYYANGIYSLSTLGRSGKLKEVLNSEAFKKFMYDPKRNKTFTKEMEKLADQEEERTRIESLYLDSEDQKGIVALKERLNSIEDPKTRSEVLKEEISVYENLGATRYAKKLKNMGESLGIINSKLTDKQKHDIYRKGLIGEYTSISDVDDAFFRGEIKTQEEMNLIQKGIISRNKEFSRITKEFGNKLLVSTGIDIVSLDIFQRAGFQSNDTKKKQIIELRKSAELRANGYAYPTELTPSLPPLSPTEYEKLLDGLLKTVISGELQEVYEKNRDRNNSAGGITSKNVKDLADRYSK